MEKFKNLKTFEEYSIKESFKKPGPNIDGSKKLELSEEDLSLFSDVPFLQKLIRDEKVSLIGNTLYYIDEEVLDEIKNYI